MKSDMRKCLFLITLVLLPLWGAAQEVDKPYHGDGPDDVLRFVPIASVFALKACGVEGASSWKRLVVNTAASYALSAGTAWGLKHSIRERRPDGTDGIPLPDPAAGANGHFRDAAAVGNGDGNGFSGDDRSLIGQLGFAEGNAAHAEQQRRQDGKQLLHSDSLLSCLSVG